MAPTPLKYIEGQLAEPMGCPDGEGIVISGMAGVYPQSQNIKDLENILYKKVNPVTSSNLRWNRYNPESANHTGNVPDLDRFDAQFFRVSNRQGHEMDPSGRKLLEQAYAALYDAGINPDQLSDKKVGVFIGAAISETEKTALYYSQKNNGLGITGCSKSMMANRISYWLNTTGPSVSVNDDSCSSTLALEQAYQAIKRGECESALVGAGNIILHSQTTTQYGRIFPLATDGTTRSYDQNASGISFSEAINVVFLQKRKNALRVYAEIVYVKCEYGFKTNMDALNKGLICDPNDNIEFLRDFYTIAGVPAKYVKYIEGSGVADPKTDIAELETYDKVFCKDREEPLLVGSVTSNIGYSAAASGISGITKVLIGYKNEQLPGNLHCDTPRSDVAGLVEGRVHIVNDHQPLQCTYAAVSSLSITGVYGHVLLHGHLKPKIVDRYKTNIPRLVNVSGRTEPAVKKIFDILLTSPIDPEQLALLNNIHKTNISNHLNRGFIILDNNTDQKTVKLSEKITYYDNVERPLWFVYSGMGSQWAGMGKHLMRIPIFASSIERCHRVLTPKGIDLIHIITTAEKTIFDNVLHSFVGIAAIQIGLTDVLKELGLVPDKIIGHSVGELGCAYADGCLTREEMILSAYSRGLVSLHTPLIRGSMAAVGTGADKMSKMCPPDIEVACHNSSDSCTISGPAERMRTFVADLAAKGIFAKEVPCSNIAYHSRYIADAGPGLLKYLKEIIKTPKARSPRWISTSVPQKQWDEQIAKYCSAEYHTNNLLSPVLFEECSSLIPSNAVLVEVAPHGLLQAILKRSLPSSCTNIPLTHRANSDSVVFLLEAIGKLYMEGYKVDIKMLYPEVEFPVSNGTDFLNHFVEWSHSDKWHISQHVRVTRKLAAQSNYVISVYDREHAFLKGHVIRNKVLLPYSYALVATWDTLLMSLDKNKKSESVEFSELQFFAQPILYDHCNNKLAVSIHKGNGRFEVMSGKSRVISGFIKILKNPDSTTYENVNDSSENMLELESEHIYQIFSDKDYSYSGDFQSIEKTNNTFTEANLIWKNNWVNLIDGMIQLNVLKRHHYTVSELDRIEQITIDVKNYPIDFIMSKHCKNILRAYINDVQNYTRCGGIVVKKIKFNDLISEQTEEHVILEELQFVPKFNDNMNGQWGGKHMLPLKQKHTENQKAVLLCEKIGDFNSLRWVYLPGIMEVDQLLQPPLRISVKVHYASLNTLDIKRAAGTMPFPSEARYKTGFGMQFSGLTDSGEKVMGVVKNGAVTNHIMAQPDLLWPVPSHWTLEDAATVPFAYMLVYYCLNIKINIETTQNDAQFSVLVHGGAGALGQAMISVALAKGYKVFATVGTEQKKRFLLRLFPELQETDIGNSRDESFGDMVMAATGGNGCNLIFCCLKGNLKNASLKCCAFSGTTFDTILINEHERYNFGMHYLTKARTYIPVEISSILSQMKHEDLLRLRTMLCDGIALGHVRPLSRATYSPQDVSRAFQLLATSQHRGCVLLRMQDSIPMVTPLRLTCARDRCHLIISNTNLGIQIVDMLIRSGANKIHLHGYKLSPYVHYRLREWRKLDVQVSLSSECDNNNLLKLLDTISSESTPLDGVYIQNRDDLIGNLDTITRKLYPSLRYFVVICDSGLYGQKTCNERTKDGLPATLIDISNLKLFCNNNATWCRKSVEAIQNAILTAISDPILIARLQSCPKLKLIQKISSLTGVEITKELSSNTTLRKLGINNDKSLIIAAYLRDTYHVSIAEEEIPLLTIKQLQQIENMTCEPELKEITGLDKFISHIDPDELETTYDTVYLKSLATNIRRNDEFNANEAVLCIIPGLEGHHKRFKTLCKRLLLTCIVMQPGLDDSHETPQALARRYAEILLKKIVKGHRFNLLGYEAGVVVALELGAILEEHGKTGTIFCLGDGPDEIKVMLEAELSQFKSEEALQAALARHMFSLMAPHLPPPTEDELEGCTSWPERIDTCVQQLHNYVPHSKQYVRAVLDTAYARIDKARTYIPKPRALQSKIVLIRAQRERSMDILKQKCSLQQYARDEITIQDLVTSIPHVASDLQVPAIIHQHLDEDTLQILHTRNACNSYLVNPDMFAAL